LTSYETRKKKDLN